MCSDPTTFATLFVHRNCDESCSADLGSALGPWRLKDETDNDVPVKSTVISLRIIIIINYFGPETDSGVCTKLTGSPSKTMHDDPDASRPGIIRERSGFSVLYRRDTVPARGIIAYVIITPFKDENLLQGVKRVRGR